MINIDTYPKLIDKPVRVLASLSSGASSAVAADIAIRQFGKDRVELIFMDTQWEDEDNYRFLEDLRKRWDMPVTKLVEGRTPLKVAKDEHIIPNQKIAPCTHKLKIELFCDYLKTLTDDYTVIVVVGMDAGEERRMPAPKKRYESMGAKVWFPLAVEWRRVMREYRNPKEIVMEWGIALPRMYSLGYRHANCGGRCVKQGQRDWRITLERFPERFEEVAAWEREMRKDDRFKDYAILRDQTGGELKAKPLDDFRAEVEARDQSQPRLWDMVDDLAGCSVECGVA